MSVAHSNKNTYKVIHQVGPFAMSTKLMACAPIKHRFHDKCFVEAI